MSAGSVAGFAGDLRCLPVAETAELAQIAVSYRTYPHVDAREVGVEACELLHRAMSGEIAPKLLIRRPPMLVGCDDGRTTEDGPMCRLLEDAAVQMQRPGILNVAINAAASGSNSAPAATSPIPASKTAAISAVQSE